MPLSASFPPTTHPFRVSKHDPLHPEGPSQVLQMGLVGMERLCVCVCVCVCVFACVFARTRIPACLEKVDRAPGFLTCCSLT